MCGGAGWGVKCAGCVTCGGAGWGVRDVRGCGVRDVRRSCAGCRLGCAVLRVRCPGSAVPGASPPSPPRPGAARGRGGADPASPGGAWRRSGAAPGKSQRRRLCGAGRGIRTGGHRRAPGSEPALRTPGSPGGGGGAAPRRLPSPPRVLRAAGAAFPSSPAAAGLGGSRENNGEGKRRDPSRRVPPSPGRVVCSVPA